MSRGSSIATKGATRGGTAHSTKGVIDEAADVSPPVVASSGTSKAFPLSPSQGAVQVIIPTSTNFMLMAVENITANLRTQQSANLTLPSLYKRAYLVAYETDEVAVVKP